MAALTLILTAAAMGPAAASPGDPIHSSDVLQDGWDLHTWYHLGRPEAGAVSAESWVDVHWPCFTSTDEDQDCVVEDVRGHGLVRKEYRVKRTQINLVRLGRYPSGVLAQNTTPLNSGTLPLIERRTSWVTAEQFCGADSFRAWTRTTFDVRWSDDKVSQGLTLLGPPTEDMATLVCPTLAMTAAQRQAYRQQLLASR